MTNHEPRIINYESRIMWWIHSTKQRIFMNCYKSRITNTRIV